VLWVAYATHSTLKPVPTLPRYQPIAVTACQIPDAVDTVVCAPDAGWKYHPEHVEQFPDINKLCDVASCWIYEYTGILLGARPILHISRVKVKMFHKFREPKVIVNWWGYQAVCPKVTVLARYDVVDVDF
jgi:hypothetical protein